MPPVKEENIWEQEVRRVRQQGLMKGYLMRQQGLMKR